MKTGKPYSSEQTIRSLAKKEDAVAEVKVDGSRL